MEKKYGKRITEVKQLREVLRQRRKNSPIDFGHFRLLTPLRLGPAAFLLSRFLRVARRIPTNH